jgi:uncharacterized protein (TIGR03118 family)
MRASLFALCILCLAASSCAPSDGVGSSAAAAKTNAYRATILVSNEADEAPVPDVLLVNAWGIAASPTSPWWVADNGSGMSTVYTGAGVKLSREVVVPGAPTGMVWNGAAAFDVAPDVPAVFMWASEDGTISGWNPTVDMTHAIVVVNDPGSIYKGLAIHGDRLFTTDFGDECSVEALDGTFTKIETDGDFADPSIPANYCPFGIQVIGDSVFVSYALKGGQDDIGGQGHGAVREFDLDGHLVAEVGTHGQLNSPWGMAMAPASGFGRFSGCLLVGNFGDGQLNAFCLDDDGFWHPAGQLRDGAHPLVIDGLWGIGFGNGAAAGPTNVLYFAAGPDDESNGYFGKIEAQ